MSVYRSFGQGEARKRTERSGWVVVMSRAAASEFRSSRPIAATVVQANCLTELVENWRTLKRGLLDPYRPELHYMRGPGPKWHEKHIASAGRGRRRAQDQQICSSASRP